MWQKYLGYRSTISTHALREEGDRVGSARLPTHLGISTHALREEGDMLGRNAGRVWCDFYPRPPRGGRPGSGKSKTGSSVFLPTPSARRATFLMPSISNRQLISTHALREEGDYKSAITMAQAGNFYPRPPRGGRPVCGLSRLIPMEFLPTPSARRATMAGLLPTAGGNFYPRPPRGGRRPWTVIQKGPSYFYPRPPRGGRQQPKRWMKPTPPFLPTPSARRATSAGGCYALRTGDFYPRPPRGGRRAGKAVGTAPDAYFYPRPPRGGRQQIRRKPHPIYRQHDGLKGKIHKSLF